MDNEELAELPFEARLLFIYLWMLADCDGRLEERPKRIKAQALPYDDIDVQPLLDQLVSRNFLERYVLSEQRYLRVVNFDRHQHPHPKEAKSVLPGPEEAEWRSLLNNKGPSNSEELHGDPRKATSFPGGVSESLGVSETLGVNVSTYHRDDDTSADDTSADRGPVATPSPTRRRKHTYTAAFEAAWADYPRRSGNNPKLRAFRAWNARLRQGHSPSEMHTGVQRYAAWCAGTGKIGTETVMMAATFFGPDKPFTQPWELPDETDQRPRSGAAVLAAGCADAWDPDPETRGPDN